MMRRLLIAGTIATASIVGLGGLVWAVGALLPQDHVAATRAVYAQTPDSIFRAIVDVAAHPSWRADVSSVELLSSDPLRWRETGEYGSITYVAEETVTPTRFVARIDDPSQPFGGRWTWRVEPDRRGGSIVSITEEGEIYSPLFRFFARFVFGYHGTQEAYLRSLGERFGERTEVERVDGAPGQTPSSSRRAGGASSELSIQ